MRLRQTFTVLAGAAAFGLTSSPMGASPTVGLDGRVLGVERPAIEQIAYRAGGATAKCTAAGSEESGHACIGTPTAAADRRQTYHRTWDGDCNARQDSSRCGEVQLQPSFRLSTAEWAGIGNTQCACPVSLPNVPRRTRELCHASFASHPHCARICDDLRSPHGLQRDHHRHRPQGNCRGSHRRDPQLVDPRVSVLHPQKSDHSRSRQDEGHHRPERRVPLRPLCQ